MSGRFVACAAVAALLGVAGCGSPGTVTEDAGGGAADTGVALDGGPRDGGPRADSGAPDDDASVAMDDGGAALDDGSVALDDGGAATDGGPSDGGPSDAGPSDAGPSDGGPSCTDPLCSGLDDQCNTGMCNAVTGTCFARPIANGTPCDDGLLCNFAEACNGGVCGGGLAVDCSGSADMCNTGACDPATGACRAIPVADGLACTDSSACTTADACLAGACSGASLGPVGDACAAPVPLDGTDGVRTVTGTTVCAADDAQSLSCGFVGGGDVVYDMTLTGPRRVTLETVAPTAFATVLHVRATCGPSTTELACGDAAPLSRLTASLQAGSSFVFVDGFDSFHSGPFTMNVTVQSPEACASAPRLTLPAIGASTVISGSTAGAANDFSSDCGGLATSPDHVFEIVVTEPSHLRFTTLVTAGPFDSVLRDSVLHIRRGPCAEGPDTVTTRVACNDDFEDTTNLSQIDQMFDPGTYYVVVDGFASGASGSYRLSVENL